MAYGQKNYNQPQGGGKYTIRQIGCFLVAFCNLLERFGRGVDPLTLNRLFVERGIYIDVDDGVRDDLGWQSITAYDGQIVLKRIGSGLPPSTSTIVKLRDTSNQFGTHFCLVDRVDGDEVYVVDSWDGKVKNTKAYGEIIQWAEFGDNTPQAVTPAVVSPNPPSTGSILKLPAVPSWRVYRTTEPWVPGTMKGKEVATLAPGKFGGLTYDILGNPHANVVTIQTRDFGLVNIYVGPETGATIIAKQAPAPTPAPQPIPQPTPAPVVTEPQPPVEPEQVQPIVEEPPKAEPVDKSDDIIIENYDPSYAGEYTANRLTLVKDLQDKNRPLMMPLNVRVTVAARFEYEGQLYYRTKKSAVKEHDWWYAIPAESLTLIKLDKPRPIDKADEEDDSLFDLDIAHEAKELIGNLSARERLVAFVANVYGIFTKLTNKVKGAKE